MKNSRREAFRTSVHGFSAGTCSGRRVDRGPRPDESWRGWWGENPVYHVPVFVLTHYARAPLVMEGGTTFHFVTEGPVVALERAREAAAGKDVRVGGGVNVIQQPD